MIFPYSHLDVFTCDSSIFQDKYTFCELQEEMCNLKRPGYYCCYY